MISLGLHTMKICPDLQGWVDTVSATYNCLIARVLSSLPYTGGPQKTWGNTLYQFSGWCFDISTVSLHWVSLTFADYTGTT